jgi:hypothetical protein
MARLLIHVEGETEESFVNEILAEHLQACGYETIGARLVGNARLRDRRGGIRAWSTVQKDIINHLREDVGCFATTMVDYYGLPQAKGKAWPGRVDAGRLPYHEKAQFVEESLFADIQNALGEHYDARRFRPFVIMHEFEGLLFSDCHKFSSAIGRPSLAVKLQEIRDEFKTPEEINDSPLTAPSKRILNLVPNYEKPLHGNIAILEIGLDVIRNQCPHFNAWLKHLESWPCAK